MAVGWGCGELVVTNDWRDGRDARRGLEVGEPLGGGLERS